MDTQRLNLCPDFTHLTGQPIQAYAVVCSVGEDEAETEPRSSHRSTRHKVSLHAIEMELAYSHHLLGFEEASPPVYKASMGIDLESAARHRSGSGAVYGCHGRNGRDLRDSRLFGARSHCSEAASEQLTRFQDLPAHYRHAARFKGPAMKLMPHWDVVLLIALVVVLVSVVGSYGLWPVSGG